ncbi:uncharacterized protein PITG_17954 [Phytophthora infestans T30-4]|uniref:Choline transporter-like protein n=1 Tax=Phytophthora infestans (strain T30-4) TaxID=403677 RepID=D0NXC6_PHYIT|nr:uncharacterized protein PITG_17954 [Phytophthora infestans T30-4]EEY67723.1 conserved hypothetical protein [Phytophthora infestans T30-4]|eukprot:XP_002896276.1 conserved hypothetical protein [Phytophthora infestans T30-4]
MEQSSNIYEPDCTGIALPTAHAMLASTGSPAAPVALLSAQKHKIADTVTVNVKQNDVNHWRCLQDLLLSIEQDGSSSMTNLMHTEFNDQVIVAVNPMKPYVKQSQGISLELLSRARCREAVEKKYRDWPFAILFIMNIGVIFVLMASLGVSAVRTNNSLRDSLSHNDMKALAGVSSGMTTLAMVLAVMMTKIIPSYARCMIIFVLWLNFGVAIAFAGIAIALGAFVFAAVGVIIAILNWCYVRRVKHRIPLAVAQLRIAEAAISNNRATYVVALVFAVLQILWVVMWSLAVLGVISHSSQTLSNTQTRYGGNHSWAFALLLLSFYWGVHVLKNVVHTTIAGTIAAFWYQSESLAKTSRKSRGAAACIAECLLAWLGSIMKYFNRWAYVYVGIYGYSFMKAGSAVSQLFHQRGFTGLINDDLVRIVIRLTAIGVGGV